MFFQSKLVRLNVKQVCINAKSDSFEYIAIEGEDVETKLKNSECYVVVKPVPYQILGATENVGISLKIEKILIFNKKTMKRKAVSDIDLEGC